MSELKIKSDPICSVPAQDGFYAGTCEGGVIVSVASTDDEAPEPHQISPLVTLNGKNCFVGPKSEMGLFALCPNPPYKSLSVLVSGLPVPQRSTPVRQKPVPALSRAEVTANLWAQTLLSKAVGELQFQPTKVTGHFGGAIVRRSFTWNSSTYDFNFTGVGEPYTVAISLRGSDKSGNVEPTGPDRKLVTDFVENYRTFADTEPPGVLF